MGRHAGVAQRCVLFVYYCFRACFCLYVRVVCVHVHTHTHTHRQTHTHTRTHTHTLTTFSSCTRLRTQPHPGPGLLLKRNQVRNVLFWHTSCSSNSSFSSEFASAFASPSSTSSSPPAPQVRDTPLPAISSHDCAADALVAELYKLGRFFFGLREAHAMSYVCVCVCISWPPSFPRTKKKVFAQVINVPQ
jgi:hypothetical protein